MAEIRWTDEAVRWLHDIHDYISNDSPISAQKVVTGIYDRTQILARFPEIGYIFRERKRRNSSDSAFLATTGLLTLSAMMNPLPSLAYFTVLWTSHATIFNLTILITKFGDNRRWYWAKAQPENCTPKTRSAFRVNFIVCRRRFAPRQIARILPVAPLVRARSAHEQADATGASRPRPSKQGQDWRAADPRD